MKLFVLAAVLALCACATKSTAPVPKTFDQLAVDAALIDDSVLTLSTQLLNAGTISSAQAKSILKVTDAVKAAIDIAVAAHAAGNTLLANSQLSAAAGQLATLQSCTSSPSTSISMDACLGPILPSAVTP